LWRKLNKDKVRASEKKYRETHKKKHYAEQQKKYREANAEKVKESNRAYYQLNKQKKNEYSKAQIKVWRKSNPEKVNNYYRTRRTREKSLPATFSAKEWNDALVFFDYKCAYCSTSSNVLHQEHFIPLSRGGGYTKDNIVPACPSCNNKKLAKQPLEWLATQPHGLATYARVFLYLSRQTP